MKIFAEKFRGFRWIEIDLAKINFLVGDNSSGKSSLIYLIDALSKCDLMQIPRLDDEFGIGEFDYFSPYFSYGNVTFGFSTDGQSGFSKAATVRRRDKLIPEMIRCSYLSNGLFVSFRKFRNIFQAKTLEVGALDNKSFLKLHKDPSGYKNINVEENISLGEPSLILVGLERDDAEKFRPVFRAALDNIIDDARIVSPTRALPEQFYNFKRKFNSHGLHFAAMWMDFEGLDRPGLLEEVQTFGKNSKLFDTIRVKRIADDVDDSPLIVSIEKSGASFLLNQVGVGVSQVVPVLIETIYALHMGDTTLLMQQPELHLHPIAQAALGTYLIGVAKKGLRPVIETHSSFLIDRFRADIRDLLKAESAAPPPISNSDLCILFCENTTTGNKVYQIGIEPDGSLVGEPPLYHSFFVDELIRTMI